MMRMAATLALLAAWTLPLAAANPRQTWRKATDAELSTVLPLRAPVEKEHIETEMRTASGITDGEGHFIAGVVLITAGYSADGKYSHYLVVQVPIRIAKFAMPPGNYLLGWTRAGEEDALAVHFNVAATGKLIGTVKAKRIQGPGRVESIHIWPPQSHGLIQIGRFGIPFDLVRTH